MSIFDWMKKIRQKPEVERRRILVGSTFLITAFIFVIWLSVRLYDLDNGNKVVVKQKDSGSPLSELFDAFGKFSKNITESVASIKSAFVSTTSSSSDIK